MALLSIAHPGNALGHHYRVRNSSSQCRQRHAPVRHTATSASGFLWRSGTSASAAG